MYGEIFVEVFLLWEVLLKNGAKRSESINIENL